jgi:hypothetical protein
MSTPFTLEATLLLPPDIGLPPDALKLSVASWFNSEADFVFQLTDAGTKSVDLGSIASPGIKGLLIKVDPSASASPVIVKLNGSSTGGIEISPGGGFVFVSPSPVAGITELAITYTTAITVRMWALG